MQPSYPLCRIGLLDLKQLYFVSGFKFFSGPKYRRLILQFKIKFSVLL